MIEQFPIETCEDRICHLPCNFLQYITWHSLSWFACINIIYISYMCVRVIYAYSSYSLLFFQNNNIVKIAYFQELSSSFVNIILLHLCSCAAFLLQPTLLTPDLKMHLLAFLRLLKVQINHLPQSQKANKVTWMTAII